MMTRLLLRTIALSALAATALPAQSTGPTRWLSNVAVSAFFGELQPSGRSELYSLLDRSLSPGSGALQPRLGGGALHVSLPYRLAATLGAERGGRTMGSSSRMSPNGSPVPQQTTLDVRHAEYVGVEWTALRWQGGNAGDRARVMLGGGAGALGYRLRQWGSFVDEQRSVVFDDDFTSTGTGKFAYASVGLEVPVRSWVAVRGMARRQFGSAPMAGDYAEFDRLDIGGTAITAGVSLRLAGRSDDR